MPEVLQTVLGLLLIGGLPIGFLVFASLRSWRFGPVVTCRALEMLEGQRP